MKKNILVICALGYATSTMMKKRIEDCLSENNFTGWSVEAVGLKDSKNYVKNADIIVSSVGLKQEDYDVPVINGVPLISGIRKEATFDEIIIAVKESDK